MACTIAVKLHRRNLEQVKETPEERIVPRSLQRVHRVIAADRRERERKRDYVRTRKEEITAHRPGIIFILSRKPIVWLVAGVCCSLEHER